MAILMPRADSSSSTLLACDEVGHDLGLGHLEREEVGREVVCPQVRSDAVDQSGVGELSSRDIDGQTDVDADIAPDGPVGRSPRPGRSR